jgi:hypothetical protein
MTFADHNSDDHNRVGGMNRPFGEETLPALDGADELDWLMSLALDDALDAEEAARLDVLLAQAPENMERWASWQAMDNSFHQVPSVLPPVDFGDKFARRLQIQERQRRLRTGIIFGVAAAALWGSALVGIVMLGAMLWSNQGVLLADIVHNIAYLWTAAGQYWELFLDTLEALWAVPQTRALFACYVVAAIAILAGWFVLLRRSTQEVPLAEVQFVEA